MNFLMFSFLVSFFTFQMGHSSPATNYHVASSLEKRAENSPIIVLEDVVRSVTGEEVTFRTHAAIYRLNRPSRQLSIALSNSLTSGRKIRLKVNANTLEIQSLEK